MFTAESCTRISYYAKMCLKIRNIDLVKCLLDSGVKKCEQIIINNLQSKFSVIKIKSVETFIKKKVFPVFIKKWRLCSRNLKSFLQAEKPWLYSWCRIQCSENENIQKTKSANNKKNKNSVGRPTKKFRDLSESSQRRKMKEMIDTISIHTPDLSGIEIKSKQKYDYSDDEALALFIDCKLSKDQYENLQKSAKAKKHYIYPPYKHITKAKTDCYPTDIKCDEISAKIKLQNLLDVTSQRLYKITTVKIEADCVLFSKWGCDGASNQATYRQLLPENESDASVFIVSIVPLLLKKIHSGNIVWKNPSPSSTRYCRPLQFDFRAETSGMICETVNGIDNEIKNLAPSVLSSGCTVSHELMITMLDGKACNALAGNSSSQTCYI